MRNVFACLVHERQEVVVDLVRNLNHMDPASQVLLYNGGSDPGLLQRRFTVAGPEPLVHPSPTPLRWGVLHRFAVDCMRYALAETPFDTLTIVDSDQLLVRPGYSEALAAFLDGRDGVGMLGNAPAVQPPHTRVAPAVTALRERALWLPYCRRFAGGEAKFPHWTFWPSTVFTAAACRDVVRAFDEDAELARTLAASRLWATEEILLPTLVALHGHQIARSPFSYDLVRYRVLPTPHEMHAAMARPDVFWVHPVPRRLDDRVRRLVRERHDQYRCAPKEREPRPPPAPILLTLPILETMHAATGRLGDDEADLLVAGLARALGELPEPHAVVELGARCDKTRVVLEEVVRALTPHAQVHAIGALDSPGAEPGAAESSWQGPVSFLLVNGLHGHPSARDLGRVERSLIDGAYVALHACAGQAAGEQPLARQLLADGHYARVALVGSMVLLRKLAASERRAVTCIPAAEPASPPSEPLVSCVMATYGRAHLVPQAVASFLRQTHTAIELLVIDDSPESLAGVLPDDERIRHVRLDRRQSIGAKRNLGCEAARGDLLANWDDDDWYAPWRLAYQAGQLVSDGADVCGLDRLLYFDPVSRRAWRYAWPPAGRPWVHDAVLLFTRDFWRRNPFPDTSMGIDCRMLWTATRKRILALSDERFYVGMVHPSNTSPKNTTNGLWSPCPAEDVESLIDADLPAYRDALAA